MPAMTDSPSDHTDETIPWPLPVHPVAEMLPMMSGEEIRELADAIAAALG